MPTLPTVAADGLRDNIVIPIVVMKRYLDGNYYFAVLQKFVVIWQNPKKRGVKTGGVFLSGGDYIEYLAFAALGTWYRPAIAKPDSFHQYVYSNLLGQSMSFVNEEDGKLSKVWLKGENIRFVSGDMYCGSGSSDCLLSKQSVLFFHLPKLLLDEAEHLVGLFPGLLHLPKLADHGSQLSVIDPSQYDSKSYSSKLQRNLPQWRWVGMGVMAVGMMFWGWFSLRRERNTFWGFWSFIGGCGLWSYAIHRWISWRFGI